MSHPVRYTQKRDVHIAFQVVGDGPIDLVYTPGIWSNLDVMWDEPRWAPYLRRLASFSRLIVFDMRGVGLSDRGPEPPLVEVETDDIGAVMDAAGSETAAVFGGARGAAAALLVRGLASRAHAGAGAVRACRANTGSARLPLGLDRGALARVLRTIRHRNGNQPEPRPRGAQRRRRRSVQAVVG